MRNFLLTFSCAFFIALCLPCIANAEASKDMSGLEEGQTSILYDSSIGMPTSEANTIVQTSDGFIWIGSYSGLVLYDGNSFERFDSTTGISSVNKLYVDSNDNLWIGTNDNGLALYDKGDFTFYSKEDGLSSSSVRCLTEDSSGNLLIGTTAGLFYLNSDNNINAIDHEKLNDEYIYNLCTSDDGMVYGSTITGEIFSIEDLKISHILSSEDLGIDPAYSITFDPENSGYVYVGTSGSTIIHGNITNDMADYETLTASKQTQINALLVVDDNLWVCSTDGIGYFSLDGTYTKLSSIAMTSSVTGVMEDREGNLWFVSSRQGVMKITTSMFTDLNRINGLDDMVVNTTFLKNQFLYVGTDTGLVLLNSDYEPMENELTNQLSGCRIRSIKEDTDGSLWFCTFSNMGLVRYDSDGTITCYTTENSSIPSNKIRTILQLSNGYMCASTSGGVIFINPQKEISSIIADDDGLLNTEILTICEDTSTGLLYLGSDGSGMYILDGKTLYHKDESDGLTSDVILRMKYDEGHGLIWIITSNSIEYMKDGEIHAINNFPYTNNFDLFIDSANNVWVLSSDGIYVVDYDNLIADSSDLTYHHYNSDSGLPYVTTANSRNYLADNGMLYISGTAGVSMVNINRAQNIASSILFSVPYVDVDGERVYLDDDNTVTIPSNCKRLTIYGYALSYCLDNPNVSYYLKGFDNDDTITTKLDLTAVDYTNLDGGTYYFNMSTLNDNGVATGNSISIKIIKKKALYELWGFRILIVLFAAALVIGIVFIHFSRKTKALEKKQKETRMLIDQITKAFAKCIDKKDHYTNGHSFRVAEYSRMIAKKIGYSEEKIQEVYHIALLHDVGKLSIPDNILNKNGKLDDDEFAVMKSHSANGYEVLKEITIDPNLAIGAGYHHERLDGRGYPRGVKGDEIPYVAQLIAVADTFDAMYSTRPYRKQLPLQSALDELRRVAGSQLNPDLVEAFVEIAQEGELEKLKL